MNSKETTLFVWDSPENFELRDTKRNLGISAKGKSNIYKAVYQFQSSSELSNLLDEVNEEDNLIFACHVSVADFALYKEMKYSDLNQKFNIPVIHLLSTDGDTASTKSKEFLGINERVLFYDQFTTLVRSGEIRAFKKSYITPLGSHLGIESSSGTKNSDVPKKVTRKPEISFKYAIFTALYQEFKEMESFIDWDKNLEEDTGSIVYKIGKTKDENEYIVGCHATKTGFAEAGIICAELINRYNPKFLLMPGVCGGSDKTGFGDVIVANKVFLLGKGKIKDSKEKDFLINQTPINLKDITDLEGNPVKITVETFQQELEVIDTDDVIITRISENLEKIEGLINIPYKTTEEKIKIRIAPMACSLSVIDKEDYFECEIQGKDRKTKAVEMESYSVARAAKKINGGKTKFLIFKSVMDKAKLKNNDFKAKAAYTSAQFLRHLIQEKVL